jgi:hypothetical protein
MVWDPKSTHNFMVENPETAWRDCTHGQLIVPGDT